MKIQAIAITVLTLLAGSAWAADATNTDQTGLSGQGRGQMREKLKQKILAKFDTNHDGKLEPDELAAAKAAIQKWRENHKGQGQGMGQGMGQGRRHRQSNAQQQDSAPPSADNPGATKVDVPKAILEDTKPDPVSF